MQCNIHMIVDLTYNNKYYAKVKNNSKNLLKNKRKLKLKYNNLIKNIYNKLLIYQ